MRGVIGNLFEIACFSFAESGLKSFIVYACFNSALHRLTSRHWFNRLGPSHRSQVQTQLLVETSFLSYSAFCVIATFSICQSARKWSSSLQMNKRPSLRNRSRCCPLLICCCRSLRSLLLLEFFSESIELPMLFRCDCTKLFVLHGHRAVNFTPLPCFLFCDHCIARRCTSFGF